MKKLTTEEFKEKVKNIYGDKYDLSPLIYNGSHKKVELICKEHGNFNITATNLLSGHGCPYCSKNKHYTNDEFKRKLYKMYGDRFDLSLVKYVNMRSKVKLICKKHGEFEQYPKHLLKGISCPYCISYKLEEDIEKILKNNEIDFVQQKHFEWLGKQSLDFYIPSKNIAIECQGIQHFKPFCFGFNESIDSMEKRFLKQRYLDDLKKKKCEEHYITILYYSNLKITYPYFVYTNKNELLKTILI